MTTHIFEMLKIKLRRWSNENLVRNLHTERDTFFIDNNILFIMSESLVISSKLNSKIITGHKKQTFEETDQIIVVTKIFLSIYSQVDSSRSYKNSLSQLVCELGDVILCSRILYSYLIDQSLWETL